MSLHFKGEDRAKVKHLGVIMKLHKFMIQVDVNRQHKGEVPMLSHETRFYQKEKQIARHLEREIRV